MQGRSSGRLAGELLVLSVADRRCAIPTGDVVEVVPIVFVDPLPSAPPVVEGVIDLRGTIVPVLSLRHRFGLPPRPVQLDDRLVVVDVDGRRLALHVDHALDLRTVGPGDVDPDPPAEAARYAAGMARLADGVVAIHDLAAFLEADEAVALDAALAAAFDPA